MFPGRLNQIMSHQGSPRCCSCAGKLLTHFVHLLVGVAIEITGTLHSVENRVDNGHRENLSGIVERVPHRGVVVVSVDCFSEGSKIPQIDRH
jgi:hypothetical protein